MASSGLLFALTVFGLLIFFYVRQKTGKDSFSAAAEGSKEERKQSYHAVEIHAAAQACPAVRSFRDKRFLSRDAPPIPLPSCSAPDCDCVYVHYDDRRSGPRRDAYLHGAYRQGERKQERRRQTGRRFSDRMLNMGH